MGREKNVRKLHYKPMYTEYAPKGITAEGKTVLLHEEIEAIYLMDVLELYQADAAKSMEVSRPTFARIIKSARKKLASALVSGYEIKIEDDKAESIIAVFGRSENNFSSTSITEKFIHIFKVDESGITLQTIMKNPLLDKKSKPAIVLPKLFFQKGVNVFISSELGEGLKNSLLSKGIKPVIKKKFVLEDLIQNFNHKQLETEL